MNTKNIKRVCPVELAGSLDNNLRKIIQNPRKILKPYIQPGMTVLDMGCGPGFFTMEIAKMLNGSGKVIAADLQEGMLEKVKTKIRGSLLEKSIELHKCEIDRIGVTSLVDFVLAFYVIHEIQDHLRFFKELRLILRPGGKLYIIEPIFHVSAKEFKTMINNLEASKFEIIGKPKNLFNRTVLVQAV